MSEFAHLNVRSEHSLAEGSIRIEDLAKQAAALGMKAVALTDDNLHGAAKFYFACKKYKIKPIIGYRVTIQSDIHQAAFLTLLAKNGTGYGNLVKLATIGDSMGPIDIKELAANSEGLIAFGSGKTSDQSSITGNFDAALGYALEFADIFQDDFYLELQRTGLPGEKAANGAIIDFAYGLAIQLVATNNCLFLDRESVLAHELLLCARKGITLNELRFKPSFSEEQYLKTPEMMEKLFADFPEAYQNACEIAGSCHVDLGGKKHTFPVLQPISGHDAFEELARAAQEGLVKKLGDKTGIDVQAYKTRLSYELSVIREKNFCEYFLIVREFMNWAKDRLIPVGPGRGSAVGSLVAWSLELSEIDSLEYELPFERFLNSERSSLPDIDVDICERRKGEVIQHLKEIYGEGNVAHVASFDRFGARKALGATGKALGISEKDIDGILKYFPVKSTATIAEILRSKSQLKYLVENNDNTRKLLVSAQEIEGKISHVSTHASAVVISGVPFFGQIPLMNRDGRQITQFDGNTLEELGIPKFDLLSSITLTIINDTLENINASGQLIPDLRNLPLDDAATYELYASGNTLGVFQMESDGIRQYLRKLRPACFNGLVDSIALYRPGPLESGMANEYLKRKYGHAPILYPHDSLSACLKDSYGVILYQEQVMEIARIIAGYSLGEADSLRRAISKKDVSAMTRERDRFVKGAIKNGISENKAIEIFDVMAKFAGYGFNKSHSIAYALLSYRTAWLKVHYGREFMAALLTNNPHRKSKDKDARMAAYLKECETMGIKVIKPSVNESMAAFTLAPRGILYGLAAIKSVGERAAQEIVDKRRNAPYISFVDLCSRVDPVIVGKQALDALVKSGACECIGRKP